MSVVNNKRMYLNLFIALNHCLQYFLQKKLLLR